MNARSNAVAPADSPVSAIRRVGVVGIGRMGEAFARNLMVDGYQVTVHDRSQARTALLADAGATVASALGDLATCQVVLTALPDDEALAAVAGGLIEVLAPGAFHVSSSAVSSVTGHAERCR